MSIGNFQLPRTKFGVVLLAAEVTVALLFAAYFVDLLLLWGVDRPILSDIQAFLLLLLASFLVSADMIYRQYTES